MLEAVVSTRIASLGAFVLMAFAIGCGGAATTEAKAPATPASAVAAPAPAAAAPAPARDAVVMGPTEGASQDPAILEWQNAILKAVGREGQHQLFSLVLVNESSGPTAYVGIDPAALGLSAEERAAADEVQAKFANAPVRSATRASLWVTPLVRADAQLSTNDVASR